MNWRWVSVTALLAALVIGYGALNGRGVQTVTSETSPQQPGYYLKDAVITQTQKDGSLALRVAAGTIAQRPQDDSFVLSAVRVDYFQAPGREWVLSSQRGFVPADSRVLHLEGDVELRPADAGQNTFLRTDALAIDTQRNVAYSTRSPVQIRFGRQEMTVKSFTADLNTERIRLESVSGRYVPE